MNNLVLIVAATALLSNVSYSASIRSNGSTLNSKIEYKTAKRQMIRFIRRPALEYTLTPGATIELVCEACGSPSPTTHWYRNDAPLYEYDLESNEIVESKPKSIGCIMSKLLVTRVDHRDVYTCVAVSGSSVITATTTVTGTEGSSESSERKRLVPLAPRILLSYTQYVEPIGSDIILPCHAKGHPKPHISWSWRNDSGTLMKLDSSMKILRSGDLLINDINWHHMGIYTCIASNTFGFDRISTWIYPAKRD